MQRSIFFCLGQSNRMTVHEATEGIVRGEVGGILYLKRRGCLSEILKRAPKRYQDPVSWAWLEFSFGP